MHRGGGGAVGGKKPETGSPRFRGFSRFAVFRASRVFAGFRGRENPRSARRENPRKSARREARKPASPFSGFFRADSLFGGHVLWGSASQHRQRCLSFFAHALCRAATTTKRPRLTPLYRHGFSLSLSPYHQPSRAGIITATRIKSRQRIVSRVIQISQPMDIPLRAANGRVWRLC